MVLNVLLGVKLQVSLTVAIQEKFTIGPIALLLTSFFLSLVVALFLYPVFLDIILIALIQSSAISVTHIHKRRAQSVGRI